MFIDIQKGHKTFTTRIEEGNRRKCPICRQKLKKGEIISESYHQECGYNKLRGVHKSCLLPLLKELKEEISGHIELMEKDDKVIKMVMLV